MTATQLRSDPFPHLVGRLDQDLALRLAADFPSHLLAESSRRDGGDKTYCGRASTIFDHGHWLLSPDALGETWAGFVRDLAQGRWLDLIESLNLPRIPPRVELRLTEYSVGGWMSRHTDRAEKAFSALVYFWPEWRPGWGGELALFTDGHVAEPATVVVPENGTTVAFARSERSWHEVRPVSQEAVTGRRALLVHGMWE